MDRVDLLKPVLLLLAGVLLLAALPAPSSGQDDDRRFVHIDEVLLPHVMGGMWNAWGGRGRYGVGARYSISEIVNRRGNAASEAYTILGSALVGAGVSHLAFLSLGPYAVAIAAGVVTSAIFTSIWLYPTPANARAKEDCRNVVVTGRDHAIRTGCDLEDGSLYTLSLYYFLRRPTQKHWSVGACLLFLRYDADGEVLRWEVDRCIPTSEVPLEGNPYTQDEEGWLRTGGWTGWLLDGVQGHRDVVARGAVDLETGEAVNDSMH